MLCENVDEKYCKNICVIEIFVLPLHRKNRDESLTCKRIKGYN